MAWMPVRFEQCCEWVCRGPVCPDSSALLVSGRVRRGHRVDQHDPVRPGIPGPTLRLRRGDPVPVEPTGAI